LGEPREIHGREKEGLVR